MTRRQYLLSKRAKRCFREIGVYSRDRFGVEQMRFYLDGLLNRCKAIAAVEVPHQSSRCLPMTCARICALPERASIS